MVTPADYESLVAYLNQPRTRVLVDYDDRAPQVLQDPDSRQVVQSVEDWNPENWRGLTPHPAFILAAVSHLCLVFRGVTEAAMERLVVLHDSDPDVRVRPNGARYTDLRIMREVTQLLALTCHALMSNGRTSWPLQPLHRMESLLRQVGAITPLQDPLAPTVAGPLDERSAANALVMAVIHANFGYRRSGGVGIGGMSPHGHRIRAGRYLWRAIQSLAELMVGREGPNDQFDEGIQADGWRRLFWYACTTTLPYRDALLTGRVRGVPTLITWLVRPIADAPDAEAGMRVPTAQAG